MDGAPQPNPVEVDALPDSENCQSTINLTGTLVVVDPAERVASAVSVANPHPSTTPQTSMGTVSSTIDLQRQLGRESIAKEVAERGAKTAVAELKESERQRMILSSMLREAQQRLSLVVAERENERQRAMSFGLDAEKLRTALDDAEERCRRESEGRLAAERRASELNAGLAEFQNARGETKSLQGQVAALQRVAEDRLSELIKLQRESEDAKAALRGVRNSASHTELVEGLLRDARARITTLENELHDSALELRNVQMAFSDAVVALQASRGECERLKKLSEEQRLQLASHAEEIARLWSGKISLCKAREDAAGCGGLYSQASSEEMELLKASLCGASSLAQQRTPSSRNELMRETLPPKDASRTALIASLTYRLTDAERSADETERRRLIELNKIHAYAFELQKECESLRSMAFNAK